MLAERKHLAGLELALSIADTINVGQLEALIEQAKSAPNCSGHAESGWQSFYAVGDQGQQYRCIRCGAGGASSRGADKPLTYNCHNPQCGGKATMWPTPQYAEYRELAAERDRLQADANLYRQWFNAVQDLNPKYLQSADYAAAARLTKP